MLTHTSVFLVDFSLDIPGKPSVLPMSVQQGPDTAKINLKGVSDTDKVCFTRQDTGDVFGNFWGVFLVGINDADTASPVSLIPEKRHAAYSFIWCH